MKLFIKSFALSIFILAIITPALVPSKASATLAGFDPSNIMSDNVMSNKNTMSAAEIQNFLNTKVANCTTNQIRGYTNESRAIAPCLKDYSESGQTAAQIIWQASQDYFINPQVLIVLLQKEQGLVTDTWPRDGWWWTKTNLGSPAKECTSLRTGQPIYCVNDQYRSATGFGCSDTAPCEEQYFGFTNQIRKAAALFREVLNGGWSNYPVGANYIQYEPNAGCGGSNINIQNRATSALYRYTPYQPNAGALAAGWGTAPCGAYGNRNFYNYFTDWFGSTTSTYNNIALINKGPNLASGTRLIVGDYLLSPGGNNVLTLQADGNLVLYRSGVAVWSSGTAGRPAVYAEMQVDGNLVVYSDYTATWSSSTVGNINATLKMQADGNLVIYSSSGSALWSTSTDLTQAQKDQLYSKLPTGTLYAEQKLESPNKKYKMVLQTDGNLVVYSPTKAIWNSRTWVTAVKRLDMQPDGNLVLYDQNKKPLWNSSTWGKGASRLVMQDDGNLVVYSASGAPTWYTNTVGQ